MDGQTWKAGRAGSGLNGRRGEGGPIIGSLSPSHGFLEVDVQLLPVLTNTHRQIRVPGSTTEPKTHKYSGYRKECKLFCQVKIEIMINPVSSTNKHTDALEFRSSPAPMGGLGPDYNTRVGQFRAW